MVRKRKPKKSWSSKFYVLFMLLFFGVVSIRIGSLYKVQTELRKQSAQLLQQIEKEKELHAVLLREKEYYASDLYVEKIAREQLSLVKPNEIIFQKRSQ